MTPNNFRVKSGLTVGTTISGGNTTITGFVNATSTVNASGLAVGTAFVANSTGAYHTGTVNAASLTVGATFTANATLVNTAAINVTGAVNTATLYAATSANIASVVQANSTGIFTTGTANAATVSVGTAFIANTTRVVVGTSTGLQANGGIGSAGQVLHSNGTTIYWAADDGITSIVAANGLSGGTITSTGQIDVVGGAGLVSNSTGVHVGAANGISVAADAVGVTTGSTLTVNATGIHVNSALSITDLTLSGNLTVSGSRTYVNTTTIDVGDNIITLNADLGAVAPTENAGIEIMRGTSANVQFIWDETNDRWSTNSQPLAISSLVAAGSASGITTLAAGNTTITGFANVTSTIQGGAGLTIAGAASGITTLAAGNTTITGFVNATSSVNSAILAVGTSFVANSTQTTFGTPVLLNNQQQLRFQTVNTSAYVYFTQQNDDNFVFYTSNTTYGARPVLAIFANSITSNLQTLVPLQPTAGIVANASLGSSGQVLKTNGSTVYWDTAGGTGTVTSVSSGNGLTGGPITATGTLSVVAGTDGGLVSNSTGVWVSAGSGLLTNSTGLHVGSGNGIATSADAAYVSGGSTLTVNATGVHVNSALSITSLTLAGALSGVTTAAMGNTTITGFANVAGMIAINANTGLPTSAGGSIYLAGNYGSPDAGKMYIGDGTGWKFYFASRSAGVDTNRITIQDNGAVTFTNALSGITTLAAGNTTITGFANVSTTLQVGTNTATFGTAAWIVSNGNFGVGTASPGTKLHVGSDYIISGTATATSGAKILGGFYSGTEHLTTFGSEYSSGGAVLGYGIWPSTAAAGSFISSTAVALTRAAYTVTSDHTWYGGGAQTVAVGSAVTTSERMRLTNAGDLGIGTSSPTARVHAAGTIQAVTGSTGVQIYGDGGAGYVNGIGAYPLIIQVNSTERARIDSNGNTGIGNTAPTHKLSVNGTTYLQGVTTHAANVAMANNNITNPVLTGYTEAEVANTAATGTWTMDCTAANFFELTLTGSITISPTNVPPSTRMWSGTIVAKQDATGGRTITWPTGIKWPGGSAPPATTTANAIDIWSLMTYDGGTTWVGSLSVKNVA